EFLVNIGKDCDDPLSPEYRKDTCNLVKKWPRKDKLSSTKLTTKYALLNKIVVVN
ncbi:hypothetical protein A2U01_0064059, partial [Trifolium medium]|nr:hypothetical protein [Trifolium medium]